MNNKKALLIIIILVIGIIIGIGSTVIYYQNKEKTIDSASEKNSKTNELEESKVNELGKILFNKTLSGYDHYNFYSDNLNYNNMKNSEKLQSILDLIPKESMIYSKEYNNLELNEECFGENGEYSCAYKYVDKDTYQKYYKELFGSEKEIKFEPFFHFSAEEFTSYFNCRLEADKISCYPFEGGDRLENLEYIKFSNAKLNDNKIEIYAKYLYINFESNGIFNKSGKIDNYNEELTKETIWEKYELKASTFKLTFKKDLTGNWYWESTNLIKK